MGNANKNYWLIAAGDEKRDYSDLFLRHGIMLIGPGDYGSYEKKENREVYLRKKKHRVRRFYEEVKPGDIVILKKRTQSIIAAGIVDEREDSYFHNEIFSDVQGFCVQHGRYVTWHKPKKGEKPISGLAQGALVRTHIREIQQEAKRIIDENPPRKRKKIPPPAKKVDDEELIGHLIEYGLSSGQAEDVIRAFWKIRRLGKWYEDQGEDISEHETRTFLIIPLLLALGWPEQRLKIEWEHFDIAFFETNYASDKKPIMILESKRLDSPIFQAEEQAKEYSQKYPNCKKLVVSNGIKYKLFEKEKNEWTPRAYLNFLKLLRKHPYDDRIGGAQELLARLLP